MSAEEIGFIAGSIFTIFFGLALVIGVPLLLIVSLVRYSRTKKGVWLALALVAAAPALVILVAVAYGFANGFEQAIFASNEPTEPVATDNGLLLLKVPKHWDKQTGLNDQASLQVANPLREQYLVVITESKDEFQSSLEHYAQLATDSIKGNLTDGVRGPARRFELNGMRAIQHEIIGKFAGTRLVYLHTSLNTSAAYHQVIAWTIPQRKTAAFKVFHEVLGSIQNLSQNQTGVDWSTADTNEIAVEVTLNVAELIGTRNSGIGPNKRIMADLGADELDFVELIMALEETFEISIPDDSAEKIVTVQDLIEHVQKAVKTPQIP